MHVITKSIYATQLMGSLLLGTTHIVEPETTLNEKFDISDVEYDITAVPRLICLTIGRSPTITNAEINADEYRPSPLNATLYDHIPFIIRPLDQDLTSTEQAEYRLRSVITIDNIEYVAYYGILIDPSDTEKATILIENVDNALVPKLLTPAEHSPLIPSLVNDPRLYTDNIKYVIVSEKVHITLTPYILREIYDANKLLYPDNDVVIGEIGLCSGIDGVKGVNINNVPVEYSEIANAQLNFTVKKDIPLLTGGTTGIDVSNPVFKNYIEILEIGGMENVIINDPIRILP